MTPRQKSLLGWIGLPGLVLAAGVIAAFTRTSDAAEKAVTPEQLGAAIAPLAARVDAQDVRLKVVETGLSRIETKVDSGNARSAERDSVIICSLEPDSIRCGGAQRHARRTADRSVP